MITISYAELFWFLMIFFIIGTHVKELGLAAEKKYGMECWGMLFGLYTMLAMFFLHICDKYVV